MGNRKQPQWIPLGGWRVVAAVVYACLAVCVCVCAFWPRRRCKQVALCEADTTTEAYNVVEMSFAMNVCASVCAYYNFWSSYTYTLAYTHFLLHKIHFGTSKKITIRELRKIRASMKNTHKRTRAKWKSTHTYAACNWQCRNKNNNNKNNINGGKSLWKKKYYYFIFFPSLSGSWEADFNFAKFRLEICR